MEIKSYDMELDKEYIGWYLNGIIDKPRQYKIKKIRKKNYYGIFFEIRNINNKLLQKKFRYNFTIFTDRKEAYDERERVLRTEAIEKLEEAEARIAEASYFLKYIDENHVKLCNDMCDNLEEFEKKIKDGKENSFTS